MESLYEKLGGKNAVEAAVESFYRKVLTDERISHFFNDIDMDEQIRKQKAFLTFAFGGPHQYNGLNMREGHRHLVKRGLNDTHVDVVIELLGKTLGELEVSPHLIAEVASIAESVRDQVLDREE